MKTVSIIIPYFRKKKYIHRALRSISNQSYKDFEVIIVYDDTNKKDYIYIKRLIKNKKNFFIFKNKKNIGAGESRNIGIKKSRGKYIAFLDADDAWLKNKLEKQILFMKRKNILFSHSDYLIIDNKKKKTFKAKILDYESLLKSCDIGLSTVIIDSKLLKNLKFPNIKTKEDYVLWLRILKKHNIKIYPINKILTKWYNLQGSLSSNTFQKLTDAYKVYKFYCGFSMYKSLFCVLRLSINAMIKKI